jgi:hypothetical protein
MSVIYQANFVAQTVTASTLYDLFSLSLAAGNTARIVALYLSQNAVAQDANDAQITYQIISGYATQTTTGGTSQTPYANPRDTTTSAVTAYSLTTAIPTGGTAKIRHSDAFNDRAGLVFIPTPEQALALTWGQTGAADVLTVHLSTTSTSKTYTTGFNGTIYWAEN